MSESPGEAYDWVQALAYAYALPDNVEGLALYSRGGVYGTGNALANTIWGNDIDNVLNGAGGADVLIGLGGNDTFTFQSGEAHGDTIYDFHGNGANVGDVLRFEGYGRVADGATFRQLDATHWEIASADGAIKESSRWSALPRSSSPTSCSCKTVLSGHAPMRIRKPRFHGAGSRTP